MLTGCGFHLRGILDISHTKYFDNIALIIENADQDLIKFIGVQLKSQHAKIKPTKTAKYWLIIKKDGFEQQLTSVSSSTTPRQYMLIYTLYFQLLHNQGSVIIPETKIMITRAITINNDQILGSNFEERTIKKEMLNAAAAQCLYKISTL